MALIFFLAAALLPGAQGHFSTEEAAKCAAIYDVTLDAMRKADNVDASTRRKIRDGLAMWEYEINASAPDFTDETSKERWKGKATQAYSDAKTGIYEHLDKSTEPSSRGDYLIKTTAKCFKKIETAYQGTEHPVLPFLRAADAKAGIPQITPVASSIDVVDTRGLR